LPGAGLLGAEEPGATPPLVTSVAFLGVVMRGSTAVTQHTSARKTRIPWKTGGAGRPLGVCGVPGCLAEKCGGTAVLPCVATRKYSVGGKTGFGELAGGGVQLCAPSGRP
jgi:hypothetical protein